MAPASVPQTRDQPFLLDSALGQATTRVPIPAPNEPAGAVLAHVLEGGHDSATDIAVCDQERFLGLKGMDHQELIGSKSPI